MSWQTVEKPLPIALFKSECEGLLREALKSNYPRFADTPLSLEYPPSREFGELASTVAFEIGKSLGVKPREVAAKIAASMDIEKALWASEVSVGGPGYINFRLNYEKATPVIIEQAATLDQAYGFEKVESPMRIVVEHTSANPSGPLHLGQARNAILGDALVRMLRLRGHDVKAHFYVDDVGRQVAMLAYGYKLLGEPEPKGKPDHWFGFLYSAINCLVEIDSIKARLKQVGEGRLDERNRLMRELDEWVSVARDLEQMDPATFNKLLESFRSNPDPSAMVEEILKGYERGDPAYKRTIRGLVEKCIKGIRETLASMGVEFDSWDWESDVVWSGEVAKVVKGLLETGLVSKENGGLVFDANGAVRRFGLRADFNLPEDYEVAPLTLVRGDGTTLYTTRDIAYSLRKFRLADKVINVIGAEQSLAQLQLKLALYALSHPEAARNLIHYAYGLVELPGMRMSRRRARYITLDELLEEAHKKALEEIRNRSGLSEDEIKNIAGTISLGAIKYAFVSVSSGKNIVFTWDRVITFERNSAPFINYAYTRALGILRKVGQLPELVKYSLLTHPLERLLIFEIGRFPEVFVSAADGLKPDELANFANALAEKFHEYYEKVSVLGAETEELRYARAALVNAFRIVIRNAMMAIGIRLSDRM